MKLIIGLGNPGDKYKKTRHNLGFLTIDELIEAHNLHQATYNKKFNALISKNVLNGKKIILAKTQIYMNNSGRVVRFLIENLKLKIENLVVIHDDIDLPLGKIRIQKGRGSAGHKGVESIINALNTKDFTRIRIGIKSENKEQRTENSKKFVLQKFTASEEKVIRPVIKKAVQIIWATL